MLQNAQVHRYGRGERMIQEGDPGDSMFVMLRGTAAVSIARNGTSVRVGAMRQGDCFGEFALLTGEPRTATVRAEHDCEVLEIGKPIMAGILRDSPECLSALSALLARRKLEGEGIVRDATLPADQEEKESEYRTTFLQPAAIRFRALAVAAGVATGRPNFCFAGRTCAAPPYLPIASPGNLTKVPHFQRRHHDFSCPRSS